MEQTNCVCIQLMLCSIAYRYCAFDFHKECSKLRWHRLSLLLDQLTSKQEEFGYVCVVFLPDTEHVSE